MTTEFNSSPAHANAFLPSTSLLNLPRATYESEIDIACFGIPFDGHTIARAGARYAPAQVRQMSFNIRQRNIVTGICPLDLCTAADIGDVPIDALDPVSALSAMTSYCAAISERNIAPLAIGGDHGVALPMLRGVAKRYGPVAVIHFDAHPDTMHSVGGNLYNHATPFRRSVEESLEDPSRHIMVGIRGTLSSSTEPLDWARDVGMTILTIDDCYDLGPLGVAEAIKQVVGNHPTYISLDVDGIDPADMPGTGSPEPGGLRMRAMQVILRNLIDVRVIGADISEVSPTIDPTGYTANNAAHLMFELFCLMATTIHSDRNG